MPRDLWDCVVVGAGPAGLASATVAAEHGLRTLLLDLARTVGGQIWREDSHTGPTPQGNKWSQRGRSAGVNVWNSVTVFDGSVSRPPGSDFSQVRLSLLIGEEARIIRTRRLILCTGATELLLPFPGWTLPGVTGVGGLQALVKSGLDIKSKRVAILGTGPLLQAVGADLSRRGARIVALGESTPLRHLLPFLFKTLRQREKAAEALRMIAAPVSPFRRLFGWHPVSAHGKTRVESVTVVGPQGHRRSISTDYLAVSFGLVPATELPRHLGCKVQDGRVLVGRDQQTSVPGIYAAGEVCGIGGSPKALTEGAIAGLSASGATVPQKLKNRQNREHQFAALLKRTFVAPTDQLQDHFHAATVVCRCEGATWGEVSCSSDLREARLRFRLGMGPCQGRVCHPIVHAMRGWAPGTTRAPLWPVPAGALANTEPTPEACVAQAERPADYSNPTTLRAGRIETCG